VVGDDEQVGVVYRARIVYDAHVDDPKIGQ
jgi:hypothetical protein